VITALAGRAGDLHDVEVITQFPSDLQVWFELGLEQSIRGSIETHGPSELGKAALAARTTDFYPTLFSKTVKGVDERPNEALPIDVLLCSVTPPDAEGFCSFGLSLFLKSSLASRARLTIAELEPDLPRTSGDSLIHVSAIDYFVEQQVSRPDWLPTDEPEEHSKRIAGFAAELIRDGDTLQMGVGTAIRHLPQLGLFDQKHDLGWHSEATPPGVLTAMRDGIITGARKTVDQGKLVTTLLVPRPDELDYIKGNPRIEVRDSTYVNDIHVISAHDNMVAINNAIAVDLTGQIVAESVGPRMWSGMGGQPEFAIGAFLSKGGRSITVLPSVTSTGISRICSQLLPGSYVTVPRYFADTIVTEWGVARLLGKSQRQRALELINIAHPEQRDQLRREAQRLFWP
jgi:4-hydroxybutyrate CoA-transferase